MYYYDKMLYHYQLGELLKIQFAMLLMIGVIGQQEYMILCCGVGLMMIVCVIGQQYCVLEHHAAVLKSYQKIFYNLKEVTGDLPRHHFFTYCNRYSLPEKMIQSAYNTVENGYVYIVLSDTGSPASELIALFTKKKYNHASIAFDKDLTTMVSYNNGEKRFPPGLNVEKPCYFRKKENAYMIVYQLKATAAQKRNMIAKIEQINQEGSSYNTIGLLLKKSFLPNIMFCSQFVYCLLQEGGIAYFDKKSESVKPMDFVELDYKRKLEFVYEKKL